MNSERALAHKTAAKASLVGRAFTAGILYSIVGFIVGSMLFSSFHLLFYAFGEMSRLGRASIKSERQPQLTQCGDSEWFNF